VLKTVVRPRRAKPDKYGETKQRYMFMLTETASNDLEAASEDLGVTRSELLERLVRQFLDKLLAEEKRPTVDDRGYVRDLGGLGNNSAGNLAGEPTEELLPPTALLEVHHD